MPAVADAVRHCTQSVHSSVSLGSRVRASQGVLDRVRQRCTPAALHSKQCNACSMHVWQARRELACHRDRCLELAKRVFTRATPCATHQVTATGLVLHTAHVCSLPVRRDRRAPSRHVQAPAPCGMPQMGCSPYPVHMRAAAAHCAAHVAMASACMQLVLHGTSIPMGARICLGLRKLDCCTAHSGSVQHPKCLLMEYACIAQNRLSLSSDPLVLKDRQLGPVAMQQRIK